MHSEAYLQIKKEILNCIIMSPICFFIPLVLIFTEWRPALHQALLAEQGANA